MIINTVEIISFKIAFFIYIYIYLLALKNTTCKYIKKAVRFIGQPYIYIDDVLNLLEQYLFLENKTGDLKVNLHDNTS
ncbi:MAG: hypothetical protein RLY43_1888 [Bacteroidota bacterium]|jgi:hypothetical protein